MTFNPAAEIEALKKAIASGATRVTYNGRTVEYATLDSLRERLAWLESQASGASSPKRAFAKFVKGV